jgi:hypothetical protein
VLSGDSKSYSKRNPLIENENIDLGVGNGLTYNDPLSAVYGKKRFGHHEGFNGALAVRWKLTGGKRYFKNIDEAWIATATVFSAAYICGLECRARRRVAELALAA